MQCWVDRVGWCDKLKRFSCYRSTVSTKIGWAVIQSCSATAADPQAQAAERAAHTKEMAELRAELAEAQQHAAAAAGEAAAAKATADSNFRHAAAVDRVHLSKGNVLCYDPSSHTSSRPLHLAAMFSTCCASTACKQRPTARPFDATSLSCRGTSAHPEPYTGCCRRGAAPPPRPRPARRRRWLGSLPPAAAPSRWVSCEVHNCR
jgi:hypothetical protein